MATPVATQGLPAASTTTGAANLLLPLTLHFLAPVTGNSPPAVTPPAAPDTPPRPSTPAQQAVLPLAPSTPFATSTNTSCSGCIVHPGTPSGSAITSLSTAGPNSCWYSVTFSQQIGVFHDWFGVVEPLVNGVPGWKCKSFSTLAGATTHFNACATASVTGVYVD
ncbi:hypothetical protein BDN71DRAFT_1433934 [Pleurotus eryngii]|uniref:Ribonuclease H1 N-terminal domain-containing protein n=1 Tax=Pleurotus eryngii TaxID=5323 RepID=A0A9P5ZPW2_PLEER|nr:hypothetical protein BDN71DRAFT_1433934 [Pleurotus eryngii]